MKELKNDITSRQLTMFVIVSQIGLGIVMLPGALAGKVGHDGWITILISGVISILLLFFIILLMKKNSDKNILQINNLLYGKYLGTVFNLFIIIYLCAGSAITLRAFTEIIVIIVLKMTPPVVITSFILLPSIYLSSKGLKIICRFTFFIFIAYILLFFSFILAVGDMRFTYLMPMGKAGFNAIIKSIPMTIYSFLGFELVSIVYSDVKDKENVLKLVTLSGVFTTFFYMLVSVAVTAVFGEAKLSTQVFPIFSILKTIRLPVLERLDIFFIVFWLPAMGASVHSYFFCAFYSIKKFINFKNNNILLLFFSVLVIIFSRIPRNFQALQLYMNYIGMYGIVVITFLVFSYFFSLLNKRGVYSKVKKLIVILLVFTSSTMLTGCWDQKIYEKSGFILQFGIESSSDGKLLMSYSIPVFDPKSKERVEFLYTTETAIREAREDIRAISPKTVEGGKLQQFLVSYDLAQKGMFNLFDFVERDSIIPSIAYMAVVEGSPKEMSEAIQKIGDKPWPAFYINQLLANNISDSQTPDTDIDNFHTLVLSPGIDPIAPTLKLQYNKGKGVEVTGSALFSGDKLVGKIDKNMTAFLLAMMGKMKAHAFYKCTSLESEQKENEKSGVEFELKKPITKVDVKIVDDKPAVKISLFFNVNLVERQLTNKYDENLEMSYGKILEKEIEEQCLKVLKYTQEIGSDPIGIGDIVRAKNNSYFEAVKWENAYKNTDFYVKVKVNIMNHGLLR